MVVWVVFIIQVLILIYIGLNRGFAKNLISFIMNIVNCLVAFLVARLFVNLISDEIGDKIITEISTKYASNLDELAVVGTFSKFVTSILIGIVGFFIIYIFMFILSTILKHVILYNKAEKIKFNNKIATVLISVLSASITLVILVTPVGIAYNSVIPVLTEKKDSKLPFVSEVYFDKLTEMPDNENNVKPSKEVEYTVNTVVAAFNIANNKNNTSYNLKLFKKNFESSYFLPTVIGEVGSTAAKQWKNGEEFLGGRLDIPDGREGELVLKFLSIMERWNKKVVVEDVSTLLDIYSDIDEYGTEKLEEENGLLKALSEEDFSEELFISLYGNDDFSKMIPAVVEYGLGTAFDYVHIELDEDYVSNVDVSKLSEEDVRREARIVSGIIRTILEIIESKEKISNGQMTQEDIERIIEEVSKLKDSKVLGDIANEFVLQLNNSLENIEF